VNVGGRKLSAVAIFELLWYQLQCTVAYYSAIKAIRLGHWLPKLCSFHFTSGVHVTWAQSWANYLQMI